MGLLLAVRGIVDDHVRPFEPFDLVDGREVHPARCLPGRFLEAAFEPVGEPGGPGMEAGDRYEGAQVVAVGRALRCAAVRVEQAVERVAEADVVADGFEQPGCCRLGFGGEFSEGFDVGGELPDLGGLAGVCEAVGERDQLLGGALLGGLLGDVSADVLRGASGSARSRAAVISMPVVVTIFTAIRPLAGSSNGADRMEVSASCSASSALRPSSLIRFLMSRSPSAPGKWMRRAKKLSPS